MSTRRRAVATTLTAALVLGACGGPDPSSSPSDAGSSTLELPPGTVTAPAGSATTDPAAPALPAVPADVAGELQRVLDTRAAAIRSRDREGFVAGLAPRPSLLTTEGGYFDNLAQLPLGEFSYRLDPASLVRSGTAYWGVVAVTLELTPYDAAPVRTVDRFRFVPAGSSYRVGSTTDRAWERKNLGVQQPWDTEPVTVREGSGVLGVFDTASKRQAAGVVASVERGIADVGPRVPFDTWGSRAVVYALSDPRFLASFDDLPGGDPDALDGVAFSVPTGADDGATAATRFALSPALLSAAGARRPDADLDRLVRHELVHVAVGDRDDAAPVWLGEGVAEWVSWQAVAPDQRRVPAAALSAARRGITTMPTDDEFNDADAAVHYALAWWVCEWLAATYGPEAPWTVLEAFTRRPDDDPRKVVRDLLDISADQLAQRGAKLLRETYATGASATPTTTPSATPTAGG